MSDRRGIEVGIAVAVAVAVVGLISGIESTGRQVSSFAASSQPSPVVSNSGSRSYRDQRTHAYGSNSALPAEWWRTLRGSDPDPFAVVAATPAERATALGLRAAARAFDGAPPTIPHAIDQLAVPACLACHDGGVVIGGKQAPVMSHERHDSCVQCHVVAADPRPGATTPPPPASTFVGLAAAGPGARAWDGAPPVVPHTTWMRERCESCHGVRGLLGMRTPHPWQESCTQCHVPSAVLDQRPPAALGGVP